MAHINALHRFGRGPARLLALLGVAMIVRSAPVLAGGSETHTIQQKSRDSSWTGSAAIAQQPSLDHWGFDILISTDGFGLGTFYRREASPDVSWFLSFSVSESKDSREVERYDPYTGMSFVPGKLNRFMVLPLMAGLQYRIFREEIMDTFRPYLNAGAGPTMIYAMPFSKITSVADGYVQADQVEFFKSIGMGKAYYTMAAYIGLGANFGNEKVNALGVNFRYYFAYLFGNGIPSLYNSTTGAVSSTKSEFGGFFITLNIGVGY
jgi:hypothetical protein